MPVGDGRAWTTMVGSRPAAAVSSKKYYGGWYDYGAAAAAAPWRKPVIAKKGKPYTMCREGCGSYSIDGEKGKYCRGCGISILPPIGTSLPHAHGQVRRAGKGTAAAAAAPKAAVAKPDVTTGQPEFVAASQDEPVTPSCDWWTADDASIIQKYLTSLDGSRKGPGLQSLWLLCKQEVEAFTLAPQVPEPPTEEVLFENLDAVRTSRAKAEEALAVATTKVANVQLSMDAVLAKQLVCKTEYDKCNAEYEEAHKAYHQKYVDGDDGMSVSSAGHRTPKVDYKDMDLRELDSHCAEFAAKLSEMQNYAIEKLRSVSRAAHDGEAPPAKAAADGLTVPVPPDPTRRSRTRGTERKAPGKRNCPEGEFGEKGANVGDEGSDSDSRADGRAGRSRSPTASAGRGPPTAEESAAAAEARPPTQSG